MFKPRFSPIFSSYKIGLDFPILPFLLFSLFLHSLLSLTMNRKNSNADDIPTDDAENTEVLEEDSRSILMGIIKQLSKDMDLSRVTLPTFVLEPRSMLEKITDFMAHPELADQ